LRTLMYHPAMSSSIGIDLVESYIACVPWAVSLQDSLSEYAGPGVHFTVQAMSLDDNMACMIKVTRHIHGLTHDIIFTHDFFRGADYLRLTEIGSLLKDLLAPGAYVVKFDKTYPVRLVQEMVQWLIADAKKGQHIQRYKGLGEMNPEQLWETTMNFETRRLLKVNIEDAIAADEIFTTLMGDQVEPRREFIEKNALDVENLDI